MVKARGVVERHGASIYDVRAFGAKGDGETRVHGVSFANCTFRPVRSREGQVADREAGKLSGDGAGAIRIERADGVSFRACSLRWDGNADPGVTRAFSLHDAAAPSVGAASSLRDRPSQSSVPFRH